MKALKTIAIAILLAIIIDLLAFICSGNSDLWSFVYNLIF